eukprot:6176564-Pleurochrysis_carterae.AAC.2
MQDTRKHEHTQEGTQAHLRTRMHAFSSGHAIAQSCAHASTLAQSKEEHPNKCRNFVLKTMRLYGWSPLEIPHWARKTAPVGGAGKSVCTKKRLWQNLSANSERIVVLCESMRCHICTRAYSTVYSGGAHRHACAAERERAARTVDKL